MSTSVCMPSLPVKGISVLIPTLKYSARECQQDASNHTDSGYTCKRVVQMYHAYGSNTHSGSNGCHGSPVYFSSVQYENWQHINSKILTVAILTLPDKLFKSSHESVFMAHKLLPTVAHWPWPHWCIVVASSGIHYSV